MGFRRDLWEIAVERHGILTVSEADEAGVPAVEVRKLAHRGALRGYGHGVYAHRDVPTSELTQPAVAVALVGDGAHLQREAVLDLLGLGQLNPHRISVATGRRVRRTLPGWVDVEKRTDVPEEDLTRYEGIPATTVRKALEDTRTRMPRERWAALVSEAHRRELISGQEAEALTGKRPAG